MAAHADLALRVGVAAEIHEARGADARDAGTGGGGAGAVGDRAAEPASGKLAVPVASTSRPGRNLRVAGFGVCSVWMNMARCLLAASRSDVGRLRPGFKRHSFKSDQISQSTKSP